MEKRLSKTPESEPSEEGLTEEDQATLAQLLMPQTTDEGEIGTTMMLFGDVEEERCLELVVGLIMLEAKLEKQEEKDDIKFYISTNGGSADDMFAVYDMMNKVKKSCDIQTIGLGKVMSAGVLLLASGTKGKRLIGKNCRVMIHSCQAGSVGDIHNLQNEMEQIHQLQDRYISALVKESSLTKRELKKLIDRKVNVYLSAQEAIEYGIADKIF